jgi:hypothetical protein
MFCPTFSALSGSARCVSRARGAAFPTKAAMALRTYFDDHGNEWRVWPVTPSTGAGTLGASYQGGWLCFERTDGTDRRRLSLTQVPPAWEALPDVRLDLLCRAADPAGRRGGSSGPADGRDTGAMETEQRQRRSGPKSAIGGDEESD